MREGEYCAILSRSAKLENLTTPDEMDATSPRCKARSICAAMQPRAAASPIYAACAFDSRKRFTDSTVRTMNRASTAS